MTTHNFETNGSGNNMVNQEERGDPPEDPVVCPECPTWDNKHPADEMIRVGEDLRICQRCFAHRSNKFHCKNKKCALEEFEYIGIPATCPECRSAEYLWHEFYSFPKPEKPVKRNWKGDKM